MAPRLCYSVIAECRGLVDIRSWRASRDAALSAVLWRCLPGIKGESKLAMSRFNVNTLPAEFEAEHGTTSLEDVKPRIEDDGEDEDLDVSKASQRVWLVKVPKFLHERWSEESRQGGQVLGKVRVYDESVILYSRSTSCKLLTCRGIQKEGQQGQPKDFCPARQPERGRVAQAAVRVQAHAPEHVLKELVHLWREGGRGHVDRT